MKKLFELMDKPVPYTIDTEIDTHFIALFIVEEYTYIYEATYIGKWDISFFINYHITKNVDPHDITNILNIQKSFTVLATVVDITKYFIKNYDPDKFEFSAREKSREKVYDIFANMIKQAGYQYQKDFVHGSTIYKFKKNILEVNMKKLFQERESIDKIYRDKAIEVYENIKNWLSKNIKNLIESDTLYGHPWHSNDFSRYYNGGYILMYDSLFDDITMPLDIIFMPDMAGPSKNMVATGGIGKHKDTHKVVIIMPILLGEWNLQYIDTRFDKKTFVHEFIHYLDMQRRNKKGNMVATDIISDYYNSPEEFNAFYQEGILKLDGYIQTDKIREIVFHNLDISFQEFYKIVLQKSIFDKDFMENLNTRNERALIKRLSDYFNVQKKTYQE